jgi:hypothetical protein
MNGNGITSNKLMIIFTSSLTTSNGHLNYTQFPRTYLKVKSVKKEGKRVKFFEYSNHIDVAEGGTYSVDYYYDPAPAFNPSFFSMDEHINIGRRLPLNVIALAVAAEFCRTTGSYERSLMLASQLQDAMRHISLQTSAGRLPEGRWGI